MGQYYGIINIDKKQHIYPHDLDNGAKIMEWSYIGNKMTNALMNLLGGEWKGDRVYVVGDYADTCTDPSEVWVSAYKTAMQELEIEEDGEGDEAHSLYMAMDEIFKNVSGRVNIENHGYRIIINRNKGVYIDLKHCPIEYAWYDKDEDEGGVLRIHPLSLLLAMGNDRGGGDFHSGCHGYEYVGTWVDDVRSIRVYKEDDITEELLAGLQEFRPDFTENENLISWDKADEKIQEAKEKQN